MVRLLALGVVIALALAVPAGAQKSVAPQHPLGGAAAFKCSFPSYSTAKWADTTAEVLAGAQDFVFQLDAIDYKKGRARLASTTGAALATLVLTPTGMTIIEQTPIGNFNLTTIFVAGGTGKTFLAANSRHNGDLTAVPRISQNYGTCDLVQ